MPAPMSLPYALACAALSAALFVPGAPPVGAWPLVLVAFAPLFAAIEGQTPRRAFLLGWVTYGLASIGGFAWLVDTLVRFGKLPLPVGVLLLLLLSAYHGGRLGFACWLGARAELRGWPAAPAFVLAFLASEFFYPMLLPWYVATAAEGALPLMQAAELGGPLAVDLVLLVPSAALGVALRAWREGRGVPWAALAFGAAVPALAGWLGTQRMAQVSAASEGAPAMEVGLVQPDRANGKVQPLEPLWAATAALKARGVGLVVWPETAVQTAYSLETYTQRLPEQVTGSLGVPTLFGVRTWLPPRAPDGPKVRFNSVVLADGTGAVLGRYDKHVLLPFGEYTPFGETFPALARLLAHTGNLSPGTSLEPLSWGAHRLLVLVCYEDILPAFVNRQVAAGDPDLLVNVTNDAWFGDSAEPWIHLGEARLRAVEHRRYLVRATNSGPSGIVDATGRDVVLGGMFTEETVVGTVRFLHARTVYERVGDLPWWIAGALIWAAAFVRRPSAR